MEDSGLFRLRLGQKGLFQGRAFHGQRQELPGGWITSAVRTWVLSGSTNVWSPGLTARTSLPCAEKPRERGPYLHIDPSWPVQRGGRGDCPVSPSLVGARARGARFGGAGLGKRRELTSDPRPEAHKAPMIMQSVRLEEKRESGLPASAEARGAERGSLACAGPLGLEPAGLGGTGNRSGLLLGSRAPARRARGPVRLSPVPAPLFSWDPGRGPGHGEAN